MDIFVLSISWVLGFSLFIIGERARLRGATRQEIITALIVHGMMIAVFFITNAIVVTVANYLFSNTVSAIGSVYWNVPLMVVLLTVPSYCGWYLLNHYIVKPANDGKRNLLLMGYSLLIITAIFLYLRSKGVETLVSREFDLSNFLTSAWARGDDLLIAYLGLVLILTLATFYLFSEKIQAVITVPVSAIALATLLYFTYDGSTGLSLITLSEYDPSLKSRFLMIVGLAGLFSTIWWKSKKWQSSILVNVTKLLAIIYIGVLSLSVAADVFGIRSEEQNAIHAENRNNFKNFFDDLTSIKEKPINGYTSEQVSEGLKTPEKYSREERDAMVISEKMRAQEIEALYKNRPPILYYSRGKDIQVLVVKTLRLFPATANWVKETGYTAFPGLRNDSPKTTQKEKARTTYEFVGMGYSGGQEGDGGFDALKIGRDVKRGDTVIIHDDNVEIWTSKGFIEKSRMTITTRKGGWLAFRAPANKKFKISVVSS